MSSPLRELRRAKGWSQPKLARRAHVSVRTIYACERGHHTTQASTRRRLLRALGVEWREQEAIFGPLQRGGA